MSRPPNISKKSEIISAMFLYKNLSKVLRGENRSRQSKEGEENLLTKMEPIKR
jgi:hypothetical protein